MESVGAVASTEELEVSFGSRLAVGPVSVEIGHGIVGLLGPNGAGKTTLLKCLATALHPSRGRLIILGESINDDKSRRRVRAHLGYLPQHVDLYPAFTVVDILDYICRLKGIDSKSKRRLEIDRVIAAVGLESRLKDRIRRLSGGMMRRVGIAQAMIGSPPLILMDEPAVGLDPEERWRFRSALAEVSRESAIVVSTHDIDEVALIAHRLLVLSSGRVRFDGAPRELACTATGRVWVSDDPPSAGRWWMSADGRYRSVGDRPAGGSPADPSCEDGYLLVLEASRAREA